MNFKKAGASAIYTCFGILVVGGIFDELIFDRCDLSNTRWGKGSRSVGGEYAGLGSWTVHYKNTIDKNGVFHSGIYCSLPDPNDDIPFW